MRPGRRRSSGRFRIFCAELELPVGSCRFHCTGIGAASRESAHRSLFVPAPVNQLCLRIAARLAASAACRALSTGLALGLLFWLICSLRPNDPFSCAMGLILLFSGSASFLLYTIATSPPTDRSLRIAQVRQWIVALSLGVLVSVNGLDWMLA